MAGNVSPWRIGFKLLLNIEAIAGGVQRNESAEYDILI